MRSISEQDWLVSTMSSSLCTTAETMQCFVQGLLQDPKEHVILDLQDTYATVVDAARLKSSLSRPPTLALKNFSSPTLTPTHFAPSHLTVQTTRNTSQSDSLHFVTREELMRLENQLKYHPSLDRE